MKRPSDGVRPSDLAICLRSAGEILLERGDRTGAERAWRDLTELAGRTRDATVALWASEPGAILAFIEGRLEDAVATSYGLQAATLGGSGGAERTFLLPRALLYLGRTDAALSLFDSWPTNRPPRAGLACWLAYLGRGEEARKIRAEFGGVGSDEDESAVIILVHLLEAALLTKDENTARELARRLAPLGGLSYARGGGGFGRLLGGAAALLGEPEKARGYYLQAIEASERIRFRPEIALTRLELAELLLEHYPGEKSGAQQQLDLAIDEFRAMKMQPSLERALRHKGLLHA